MNNLNHNLLNLLINYLEPNQKPYYRDTDVVKTSLKQTVLVNDSKELPHHIKSILPDSSLIDVPQQDSFFHSIICLVNPEYVLKTPVDKKKMVQSFKTNLSNKIHEYATELSLYKINIDNIEDLSDSFKLYLCLYLDCNLIEFRTEPQYHFYDLRYQESKSTILIDYKLCIFYN